MKVQFNYLGSFYFTRKGEQGLAVFFSFTDQDKEAVRTISLKTLSLANGLKLIIEELDKPSLKDESGPAYES